MAAKVRAKKPILLHMDEVGQGILVEQWEMVSEKDLH